MNAALLKPYRHKTLLITGASGYLATSLFEKLKNTAAHIKRLSRSPLEPAAGASARVSEITGDMRERAIWDRAIDGCDFVFHFAAQTSVYVAQKDPSADLQANLLPMQNLLEACRSADRTPFILFAGSATELGLAARLPAGEDLPDAPLTIYDLHKLLAEQYLESYCRQGLARGAALRLCNVYGPGPRSASPDRGILNMMIRRALKGESIRIYGQGSQIRDYIFIDDALAAFLAAGACAKKTNGRHFVLGSGRGASLAKAFSLIAERVFAKTKRRVEVEHVPPPEGLSPIENRDFIADIRAFRKAAGFKPRHTLKDGIDRTIISCLNEASHETLHHSR